MEYCNGNCNHRIPRLYHCKCCSYFQRYWIWYDCCIWCFWEGTEIMQSGHWWMTVKCLPMFKTEVPNTLQNIKHTSFSSLAGKRLVVWTLLLLHPAGRVHLLGRCWSDQQSAHTNSINAEPEARIVSLSHRVFTHINHNGANFFEMWLEIMLRVMV